MNTENKQFTTISDEYTYSLLDTDGTVIAQEQRSYSLKSTSRVFKLKDLLAGKREFYVQHLISGHYDYSEYSSFDEALEASIDPPLDDTSWECEEDETEEEMKERVYNEFDEAMSTLDSDEFLELLIDFTDDNGDLLSRVDVVDVDSK